MHIVQKGHFNVENQVSILCILNKILTYWIGDGFLMTIFSGGHSKKILLCV